MTISILSKRFTIVCGLLICGLAASSAARAQTTSGVPEPVPVINHHHYYGPGPGYYQNVRVNDVTNPENRERSVQPVHGRGGRGASVGTAPGDRESLVRGRQLLQQ